MPPGQLPSNSRPSNIRPICSQAVIQQELLFGASEVPEVASITRCPENAEVLTVLSELRETASQKRDNAVKSVALPHICAMKREKALDGASLECGGRYPAVSVQFLGGG